MIESSFIYRSPLFFEVTSIEIRRKCQRRDINVLLRDILRSLTGGIGRKDGDRVQVHRQKLIILFDFILDLIFSKWYITLGDYFTLYCNFGWHISVEPVRRFTLMLLYYIMRLIIMDFLNSVDIIWCRNGSTRKIEAFQSGGRGLWHHIGVGQNVRVGCLGTCIAKRSIFIAELRERCHHKRSIIKLHLRIIFQLPADLLLILQSLLLIHEVPKRSILEVEVLRILTANGRPQGVILGDPAWVCADSFKILLLYFILILC